MTECVQQTMSLTPLGKRAVVADFGGGQITTDGGGLLLREAERVTGIIRSFAACFRDHRAPAWVEHSLETLVAQRVYGIALGYEDLNDHETLRRDPGFAVVAGQTDPLGERRWRERDRGAALAGKSTLNRLELMPAGENPDTRYHKINVDGAQVEAHLVDVFLRAHAEAPARIILDLDTTDDLIHGMQEGRFFHGYYGDYCYLPLYIFCGHHLLHAQLRTADGDAAAGSREAVERIVRQIRERWPEVAIVIRGDSGFAREELMAWCEANGVDYVLGLARNSRLERKLAAWMEKARRRHRRTGRAARLYRSFGYRTLTSWSRKRRVVGKAEVLDKGPNPRFVVTSLSGAVIGAQALYEDWYCARGDMENRIKEQQLCLFADRTSAATMRANQLRLWFSSVAYMLMDAVRRLGLQGTVLARAQCDTIRLKLLKIGAWIAVRYRVVRIRLSSGCPYAALFLTALNNLRLAPLPLRL